MSDAELIAAQANVLFTYDDNDRMLRVNEPDGPPAPRFFLGRTRGGNVWRWRSDLPERLAGALHKWAVAEPTERELRDPPLHFDHYCELLQAHGEVQGMYVGPAYHFARPIASPSKVVRINEANSVLVERGFGYAAWLLNGRRPCVAVVEDGMAVSICFSSRINRHVAEAGVETLEPFRGRGYATRAVAGWALAVRERGRVPLYSTSWENLASQGVARRLGLSLYGVDFSVR